MGWNDGRTIGLISYASAPSGLFVGQTYYNTTSSGAFVWNGASWDAMTGGGGGGDGIYGGSGSLGGDTVATIGANYLLFDTPSGQVYINKDNSLTSLSALVEMISTTQGFLPPVMTTTQKNAISHTASGLQVYDTTLNQLNYYNGSSWVSLTASGGDGIYGGSGTVPSSAVATLTDKLNIGSLEINDASNVIEISGSRVSQVGLGNSTFFGENAGQNDDGTTNSNTAFGLNALSSVVGGALNTAVGRDALTSTLGSNNTAIGYRTGATMGDENVAVGSYASISGTANGSGNVAIGFRALENNDNSEENVAIGYRTMQNGNGVSGINVANCIAIGSSALQVIDGDDNVAIGYSAGVLASAVDSSVFIGSAVAPNLTTSSQNVFIGASTGANIVTGTQNVIIGGFVDANSYGLATSISNKTILADGNNHINYYAEWISGGAGSNITRINLGGGTTIDASAKVQIDATDSGFLPPRMTEVQKNLITPATGLMVFDTDYARLEVYDGTRWTGIGIFSGSGTLPYSTTITSDNHRLNIHDIATASSSLLTIAKGSLPNFANIVQTISYDGVTGGAMMIGQYVINQITGGATSQVGIQSKVVGWVAGVETASIHAQNGAGFLALPTNSDCGVLTGFTSGATNKNATAYGVYSSVLTTSSTTNYGAYFERVVEHQTIML